LNEQLIQQILEIEKQAQSIYQANVDDAEQLQKQAEQEAQTLIEKARTDAKEEAQRLAADSQANGERECERILAESEDKSRQIETQAAQYFDHAVNYVLDRLMGRE
jgi:vacuolar-type H+-ATPase subunit H